MTPSTDLPTSPEPRLLTPSLASVLTAAQPGLLTGAPHRVYHATGYCNEVLQVWLCGGDTLVVKRARHDWGAPRLRASRLAAGLLRRRTGVLAPCHLDVEEDSHGRPIEAYWRIPLPTLREVWPDLPDRARPQALRSWGALMRRVHKVKLAGTGSLESTACGPHALADFLRAELRDRLVPALARIWPAALELASRLTGHVEDVDAHCAGRPVVLLHNDFHMGNVLCERRPRSIRCVGVIDLETAWAGPPEADVAQVQVLHGGAFGTPLPDGWSAHFLEGYAAPLHPTVLSFCRALHRLNLGYFAATAGWWDHVRDLQAEIVRELESPPLGASEPGRTSAESACVPANAARHSAADRADHRAGST